MNTRAVKYKDSWLDPNSQCYKLYQDKKFKELDNLLKELDAKEKALLAKG